MIEADTRNSGLDQSVHHFQTRAGELCFSVHHFQQGRFASAIQLAPHAVTFLGRCEGLLRSRNRRICLTNRAHRLANLEANAVEKLLTPGHQLAGARGLLT